MIMPPRSPDLGAWAALAPVVPSEWFVHPSSPHGVCHTQLVHIHARRLAHELKREDAETELVLTAALWHDIARTGDGWEPSHGESSVGRARALRLMEALDPGDATIVAFAIRFHCLPDELGEDEARQMEDQERAIRVLSLLKDADGLDRVRLRGREAPDPAQLRHPSALKMIPFAEELLHAVTDVPRA